MRKQVVFAGMLCLIHTAISNRWEQVCGKKAPGDVGSGEIE